LAAAASGSAHSNSSHASASSGSAAAAGGNGGHLDAPKRVQRLTVVRDNDTINTRAEAKEALAGLHAACEAIEDKIMQSLELADKTHAKWSLHHCSTTGAKGGSAAEKKVHAIFDKMVDHDKNVDICGGFDRKEAGRPASPSGAGLDASFMKRCVFGEVDNDDYAGSMKNTFIPSQDFYALVSNKTQSADGKVHGEAPKDHDNNRLRAFVSLSTFDDLYGSVFDLKSGSASKPAGSSSGGGAAAAAAASPKGKGKGKRGASAAFDEMSVHPTNCHLLSLRGFCGDGAFKQSWNLLRYALLRQRHKELAKRLAAKAATDSVPFMPPTAVMIALARAGNSTLLKHKSDKTPAPESYLTAMYKSEMGAQLMASQWKDPVGNYQSAQGNSFSQSLLKKDQVRYVYIPCENADDGAAYLFDPEEDSESMQHIQAQLEKEHKTVREAKPMFNKAGKAIKGGTDDPIILAPFQEELVAFAPLTDILDVAIAKHAV